MGGLVVGKRIAPYTLNPCEVPRHLSWRSGKNVLSGVRAAITVTSWQFGILQVLQDNYSKGPSTQRIGF